MYYSLNNLYELSTYYCYFHMCVCLYELDYKISVKSKKLYLTTRSTSIYLKICVDQNFKKSKEVIRK